MKNFSFLKEYRIYISFMVVFLIMFILFPKEGKFRYEYQKGRIWNYPDLYAPIDIPILKSETELINEMNGRASRVLPYYVMNKGIGKNVSEILYTNAVNNGFSEKEADTIVAKIKRIFNTGIISSSYNGIDKGFLLLQKGKSTAEVSVYDLYTTPVAIKDMTDVISKMRDEIVSDSLMRMLDIPKLIVPNLTYDQGTTEILHKEAIKNISPTKGVIYVGQLIIKKGETVTAETAQILDSFKSEFEQYYGYSGNMFYLYVSHFLFVLLWIGMIFLIIFYYNPFLFQQYRNISFLLLVPLLAFIAMIIVKDIDAFYLELIPFTVFALYMTAFYRAKFVFPIYIVTLMPLLTLVDNGAELFTMNVVAGAVGIISFHFMGKRWMQFISALFVFCALAIAKTAFIFLNDGGLENVVLDSYLLCLGNAFLVVAFYPLVYVFEKIFGFLSKASLIDLSDTNNTLLKQLAKNAPGTFQHSLQVANLAEAAAREIDADEILVRAGALYHDIGKMQNPHCFIENQPVGVNYHQNLSPLESAQQIIQHVEDGVALAKKYRLPSEIIDFIETHHGTSQTLYFYNQYCNDGGDPNDIDKFTYKGKTPTRKEHAILMMADTIEAASRTLKDYSEESISNLVDKILSSKIESEQLKDADISLKDVGKVKNVFKKYLKQIYHQRIAYPERKK